jgi:hypothetical protein
VGACTWASGSQVCTGHIGIFTAKLAKKASHSSVCIPPTICQPSRSKVPAELVRSAALDVGGARIHIHRDHRHQHQHRAEEGVEEELEGA